MRRSALALALVTLLGGCNDNGDEEADPASPTQATEATAARVSVTVVPQQVPAAGTGDPDFPFLATWVTNVRESAGVSATVTAISVVLADVKLTFPPGILVLQSANGSVNLSANGSLSFTQSVAYSLPSGEPLLVGTVIVDLVDARGNPITAEAQFRVF
jgi:hypothetical protein